MPHDGLHASVRHASLLTLAAVVGLALVARAVLPLGAFYPLEAGLAFGLAAILAGRLLHHHPRSRFGPGNRVTMFRAGLVALLAALVAGPVRADVAAAGVAVALVVTLLDGVDGWLARRTDMATPFGARFDMEVDACLILVLAVLAWRFDKAGAWVLLSGLLRYLFVLAGASFEWLRAPLPPSLRRKAVCVVQVLGLVIVLLPGVTPDLGRAVAAAGLATLVWSFAVDVAWLWRPSRLTGPSRIAAT